MAETAIKLIYFTLKINLFLRCPGLYLVETFYSLERFLILNIFVLANIINISLKTEGR